ncbi:Rv1355c family protein [Pendulispora albinea]|uniref:Rv1355c family protein n=1 Tax=Pendulispora albinea TaxID=2741071 RepID=A0ABZ2MBN2_9BACT
MTAPPAAAAPARPCHDSWEPVRYDDGAELARLRHSGEAVFVHDEIELQLSELMEIRSPSRKLSAGEIHERVLAHTGQTRLAAYGSWFFFPWSKTLVHVLPREEFRELRSHANRHKITTAEQDRLSAFTIGVVGLSVGQSTAVTLALEGIGGALRLADFDSLSLGNMNRLRAGVHALGVNKAVLTARAIFELDPYASLSIFPEGITDANIEAFLEGLDLLFEEADDLRMKVRLRERARALRIPVLMGTSDRGLFDVERFDREPDRPLFHGMTGPLDTKMLEGLTAYEKIPIAFAIVGPTLSKRVAASFLDISSTLATWPQLASAVALSSAINADAARRILLDQFLESGRYFVDLESHVRDGAGADTPAPPPDDMARAMQEPPKRDPLPRLEGRGAQGKDITADEARALLAYGVLAPSGGNTQPWKFVLRRGRILCIRDPSQPGGLLDFEHAATHLAFGALARNIELVARKMGREVTVTPFPGPDPQLVCAIAWARSSPRGPESTRDLAVHMIERTTNRRMGARMPLDPAHRAALVEAAHRAGAHLELIEDEQARAALGALVGEGDRIRGLSPIMHSEMMSEIRWTRQDVLARRDGLDVATFELGPVDRVGLRLVADAEVMKLAKKLGIGRGLELPAKKALVASSAVGLLTIPGTGPQAYFAGGRAMQDVWLTATACRVALQPMTVLLYMFARLERGAGVGLSSGEQAELRRLRHGFRELANVRPDHAELLLFRLFYADPPSARSLRRRVDDVLVIEP